MTMEDGTCMNGNEMPGGINAATLRPCALLEV